MSPPLPQPSPLPALPAVSTKVTSAVAYAASSVLIMIVNKIVLTTWRFPSALFLALGQFLFTAVCILVLSSWPCRRATVRPCDRHIFRTIAPLAVLLSVNVIAGLVATRLLNLAMFGALRRVSILLTMVRGGGDEMRFPPL